MRVRTKAVATGYYHSAALTENGDVYTWGNGTHGELGHSDTQVIFFFSFWVTRYQNLRAPKLVEDLFGKRITKVACGNFHTVVITDLENVYSWGRGGKGRLGIY
jgi:RCC1 and BTB domain-containing protein